MGAPEVPSLDVSVVVPVRNEQGNVLPLVEEIVAALADEGMTILMSTHDLAQARRLARRVLFLHRGRLIEDAPAQAFFASPATPEGRAFIAGELLW